MNENISIGTRVYHQNLGEGMINRVRKNDYEVVFLNGNRSTFPKDNNELTILSNIMKSKPNVLEAPLTQKEFKAADLIISNDKIDEDIFSIKEEKTTTITQTHTKNINISQGNVTVGTRVAHTELGEGMINKITANDYEVIFMNGKKIKFDKNDTALTTFVNMPQAPAKKTTEKPEAPKFRMSFKQKIKTKETEIEVEETPASPVETINIIDTPKKEEPKVVPPVTTESNNEIDIRTKVNHLILGEGVIDKITDKHYEVVFLDGKKSRFLKTDTNLTLLIEGAKPKTKPKVEKEFSTKKNITVEVENDTTQTADISVEVKKEEHKPGKKDVNEEDGFEKLTVGSRIYHKVRGEGMIGKIKNETVEIIFMDGNKGTYFSDDINLSMFPIPEEESNETNLEDNKLKGSNKKVKSGNAKSTQETAANLSLNSKWKGGTLILKPANTSLTKKEYTIESFFQIILSIRNRMASLERLINDNDSITETEKQALEIQLKSVNRSLVAFNMLFKDKEDYFTE